MLEYILSDIVWDIRLIEVILLDIRI